MTFPDASAAIVDHSGLALPTFPDRETEQVYNAVFGGEPRHDYQGGRRLLLPDGGAYWQGLPDTPRGESLASDPFRFGSAETDAIYPLPNGFPAFFLDTPFRATTPAPLTRSNGSVEGTWDELVVDCIACHSTGPAPMTDLLVDFARDNPASMDPDTKESILEDWPSQDELDAVVAADRATYDRVLQGAGLNVESATALQTITRRYALGLDVADMAAALHASETQLRAVLPAGATTLGVEDFLSRFRALLCQIHPDASAASDYCS